MCFYSWSLEWLPGCWGVKTEQSRWFVSCFCSGFQPYRGLAITYASVVYFQRLCSWMFSVRDLILVLLGVIFEFWPYARAL